MLRTIATFFVVLWLLAIADSYTMGGWIHILPVIAVVMVLIDIIQQRRLFGRKHI